LTTKNYKIILILAVLIPIVAFGITLYPTQKSQLVNENNKENKTSTTIIDSENHRLNDTTNSVSRDVGMVDIGENLKFDNNTSVYYHTHDPVKMYDNFSSGPYHLNLGELSPNTKWLGKWNGGGSLDVKQDIANNSNYVSVVESGFVLNDTRSALVLTTNEYENFKLSLDVRNDKQLRETNPNSWEVGWIFWRYVDNTHFYYFTLKPNGSESGKYDGGVNPTDQLFLESTEFPSSFIGKWDHLDIIVKKNHITVLVNGKIAQDFDDVSSFYKGRIGLYCEDASVSFDNISIIPIKI
jgi:hypothetical protein